jgi:hypothetical protein
MPSIWPDESFSQKQSATFGADPSVISQTPISEHVEVIFIFEFSKQNVSSQSTLPHRHVAALVEDPSAILQIPNVRHLFSFL